MLQVVRRQSGSSSLASRAMPFITQKARRLEIALVALAAANVFAVSSAVSFYVLAHRG